MNELEQLEPNQYQRLYWDEDTPVKDVRKSVLRKFVYIAALLCVLFITVGMVMKFPDQVELPFVLKSDNAMDIYRFSYPVYVTGQYALAGNAVNAGQPVIKITSPEIVTLINNYREAEQNLLNFKMQKQLSVERQKNIIEKGVEQDKNKAQELEKELLILDGTWKSNLARLEYENAAAIKKYDANKSLYEAGAVSKFELNEFEAQKIRAADSLLSARQNYEHQRFSMVSLSNRNLLDISSSADELSKLLIDTRYDSVSLSNQFNLVKNKISNSYGDFEIGNGDLVLKAAKAGTVSYIFDGEKEVAAGAILLKIVFDKPSFYAFVKSPPSMVGKMKQNEKAVMKVASFPFYEWGTVKGNIDNVSLSPDETGYFSVKIGITDFGSLNHLLQAGMNGNAVIILEEKTFFSYFFRKTKKMYSRFTMS